MTSLKDSIIMRFDFDNLNMCETGMSYYNAHIRLRAHRSAPQLPPITCDMGLIT